VSPVHVGFNGALLVFVARAGLAVRFFARFVDFPEHLASLFGLGFDFLDALPVEKFTCAQGRHAYTN